MTPSRVPAWGLAFAASLFFIPARAADAFDWTTRFRISPRIEATDGRSEFFTPLHRTNPFPEDLGATQKTTTAKRFATAISDLDGYKAVRSLFEPYPMQDLDGRTYSLFLEAVGDLRWDDGWAFSTRLASRQLSKQTFEDELVAERARKTFFIDEFFASYDRWDDWRTLAVGRMLLTTGRGFIHDDYQLAAKASADLDLIQWAPFSVNAAVSKIETDETVNQAQAAAKNVDGVSLFNADSHDYYGQAGLSVPISMLESAGLTYARFQERDGYFADLFNPVFGESYLNNTLARRTGLRVKQLAGVAADKIRSGTGVRQAYDELNTSLYDLADAVYPRVAALDQGIIGGGSSFLNYMVLDGDKFVGKWAFSWAAIGEWGRVTLTDFPREIQSEIGSNRLDFPVRGLLLYGSTEVPVAKKWTVRAHYLFSSGDNAEGSQFLKGDTYDSFLGLRPYIRLTNLFFSGGISENLRTGSITPSGYYGHGVWAPVVDVEWSPSTRLQLIATGAYLAAQRRPSVVVDQDNQPVGPLRGSHYGWEADIMAFYQATPWLRVAGEGDWFAPGDFFTDMPRVWKLGAGLDFLWDVSSQTAGRGDSVR
jgi:hypothetical protein